MNSVVRPKEEPFVLENVDTNLIPAGGRVDGTAAVWSTVWDFKVPAGQQMVLGPHHRFSVYLEDASAEVGNNTCRVRIAVTDNSGQDRTVIYGPVPYVTVKDFTDRRKVASLRIPAARQVYEEEHILIEVLDDGAIDESDSAFSLEMIRARQGLA